MEKIRIILELNAESGESGEDFFELNGKLSQHAISAICVENESSLSKECVHEENASARPTLIVHRSNTGANC